MLTTSITTNLLLTMPMHSPAHPGQIIREFIDGISEETGQRLTIGLVAEALGVSRAAFSTLLNGRSPVTAAMALKLAAAFQTTTPEHWVRLQESYDLAEARKRPPARAVRVLWPALPAQAA